MPLACGPPPDGPAYDTFDAAWSPDGRTILLAAYDGEPDIWAYDVESSTFAKLTNRPVSRLPDWSPSGDKIVFDRDDPNTGNEYFVAVMNCDGTSVIDISGRQTSHPIPDWSPDGSKIAFTRDGDIYTMNPDGSGAMNLTNTPGRSESATDWQPIPIGYPRPQAATPLRVSLAPAYEACAAPNRTHGPPLDSASCYPPRQASDHLTVGTSDANGAAASSTGYVRLAWIGELPIDLSNGDQGDVRIRVSITDVRKKPDLTDYAGEVAVSAKRRITDKNNTPHPGGAGPGTVQDDTFTVTVPCTPTEGTTVGSTCDVETTADTLVPGTVKERVRAMWQLEQIDGYDGGPDGDADTAAGNTLFMTQGIFVP